MPAEREKIHESFLDHMTPNLLIPVFKNSLFKIIISHPLTIVYYAPGDEKTWPVSIGKATDMPLLRKESF